MDGWMDGDAHTKKNKTFAYTRGLHDQLTPMGHSQTHNSKLNKLNLSKQFLQWEEQTEVNLAI